MKTYIGLVTIFVLLLALHLNGASASQPLTASPSTAHAPRSVLDEVRSDFTVDGKPVHPMLLQPFVPPIVGRGPEVLSFDVETAMVRASLLDPPFKSKIHPHFLYYRYDNREAKGAMGYAMVGHLDPKTVVLRVTANYGGSASVLKILVIKVIEGPKLMPNAPPAVVFALHRVIPLPDMEAQVSVVKGKVVVRYKDQYHEKQERVYPVKQ